MAKTTTSTPIGDETSAQVYRWAYRLLQNHHDALDATQEVMLKEIQRPTKGVVNRGAWLRRVTVNQCVDAIRRNRARPPDRGTTDTQTSPESVAVGGELHEAVLASLERLSGQQRAVLVAKVYDGETFAAIADVMGLSVSSVKTHYVRALEALREPLRAHMEPNK